MFNNNPNNGNPLNIPNPWFEQMQQNIPFIPWMGMFPIPNFPPQFFAPPFNGPAFAPWMMAPQPVKNMQTANAGAVKNAAQVPQQATSQPEKKTASAPMNPMYAGMMPGSLVSPEEMERRKKEYAEFLNPDNYSAKDISPEHLQSIVGMYGNEIENIYELTPGQKWMMEKGSDKQSLLLMQNLIRVNMKFDPVLFRQNLADVCAKLDNLRSAFVNFDDGNAYRVVLKNRQPELYILQAEGITPESTDEEVDAFIKQGMEAERATSFYLATDSLLRIFVVRLRSDNEYAILISQPHINTDGESFGLLVEGLFVNYALSLEDINLNMVAGDFDEYAEHMSSIDKKKELAYWKKYFEGYDELEKSSFKDGARLHFIPGQYSGVISDKKISKLKKMQKTLKCTLFTILQSAWAVAVSKVAEKKEAAFGVMTDGRDAEVDSSTRLSGGFTTAMPMRVKLNPDDSFPEITARVNGMFLENSENMHCSLGEIKETLHRKTPLFNHLLNYHNFDIISASTMMGGAMKNFTLVGGEAFATQFCDLNIIITNTDKGHVFDFRYNEILFSRDSIDYFFHYFEQIIDALIKRGPDISLNQFPLPDGKKLEELQHSDDLVSQAVSVLKDHTIFSSLNEDDLTEMVKRSVVSTYREMQEIVHDKGNDKNVYVIISGTAASYGVRKDGWLAVIHKSSKGEVLPGAGYYGKQKTFRTSAVEGEATVLIIPHEAFQSAAGSHPELMEKLIAVLCDWYYSYATLWMNADPNTRLQK